MPSRPSRSLSLTPPSTGLDLSREANEAAVATACPNTSGSTPSMSVGACGTCGMDAPVSRRASTDRLPADRLRKPPVAAWRDESATSPDGMASAYSAKRTPATSASPGSSTFAWTDARL